MSLATKKNNRNTTRLNTKTHKKKQSAHIPRTTGHFVVNINVNTTHCTSHSKVVRFIIRSPENNNNNNKNNMLLNNIFNKIVSSFKSNTVCIDNFAFSLHYRWTVTLILACFLLSSTKMYLGERINCTSLPSVNQQLMVRQ